MKAIKKFSVIIFFQLLQVVSLAQNETSKWYFGLGANIDFMPTPPTVNNTLSAMYTSNGCSSIADGSGNLLFYTNGEQVFNAAHQAMANSFGILGNYQSGQSTLIVKKPGSSNLYYIFSQNGSSGNNGYGLKYSVVDMSLAAGQGSVTLKNQIVDISNSTQKLAATKHCNGSDVWILIHDQNTNQFKALLLSTLGLNITPVISAIGQTGQQSLSGQMKFSPNGKKLGFMASYNIEIYDFDNASGYVYNYLNLAATSYFLGGCEFSPDGTKFYCSVNTFPMGGSNPPDLLYQFNLCAGSNTDILASKFLIDSSSTDSYYQLQLAQDGKIYMINNTHGLSVIKSPNLLGAACNYSATAFGSLSVNSYYGLPNFVSSYFNSYTNTPSYNINAQFFCSNVEFTAIESTGLPGCIASGNTAVSATWNFGDITSGAANTSTLISPMHKYSAIGTYTTRVILTHDCKTDTIYKTIQINSSNPTVQIIGPDTICQREIVNLIAQGANTYSWSNTWLTNSITVAPQFQYTYSVLGTNTVNGCYAFATHTINVNLCTGLSNYKSNGLMSIYPNPFVDELNFEFDLQNQNVLYSFVITDVLSRTCKTTTFNLQKGKNQKMKMEKLDLVSGIYFIKVYSGSELIQIKKIVKD